MKKRFILLCGFISLLCSLSCGRENSNTNDEDQIETPSYNFNLVSSKTQASLETILQFSFNGSLPNGITNINWDFGDGTTYFGNHYPDPVYHAFKTLGNNTVKAKILYDNGKSVEKTITVNITNANQIKINKISISRVPQATRPYYIYYGTYTVQEYFTGEWDQSFNRNSTDINRFADIYVELHKIKDIVNPSNPHNILSDNAELAYKSGIRINQQSLVYDLSSSNVILNLESLKKLTVKFKDSDVANSMEENGNSDEEMRSEDITSNQFQTSNQIISTNSNGWIYSIEYQKL